MRNRSYGLRFLVLTLFVIAGTLFTSVGTAFAADTWTPKFDAGRHVQVDPNSNAMSRDQIAEIEQQLEQLGRKHHLQYYFVYTIHGDDKAPAGQEYARWKLNTMLSQWQSQGLPLDDYVVIMVVRGKTRGFSAAASGGNRMQKWGLDGDYLTGVLGEQAKLYMPNDPAGFTAAIATQVNGAVDSYNFQHYTLPRLIVAGIVGLLLLAWTIFWFVLRRKALGHLAQWLKYYNDTSVWYDELDTDDAAGYIREQNQYRAQFEDETKVSFEAVLAKYGDLSIRKVAISDRYKEMEAIAKGAGVWWPLIGSYRAIIRKAETETVLLSTTRLSAADADVFKGLVAENRVLPSELLTTTQTQIQEVAAELKRIAQAFKNAYQNAADIKKILGEVDTMRPQLETRTLPFEPYSERYKTLTEQRDALLGKIGRNPLGAEAASQRIEDAAGALKKDIERAIKLKDGLVQTRATIDELVTKVNGQRALEVDFKYPFAEKEEAPETRTGNFLLREANGNPDANVEAAEKSYADAQTALTEGRLDDADALKTSAESEAATASGIVDRVLNAKMRVETQVPVVRAAHAVLQGNIVPAATAMATLNAEFLKANYNLQAGNVDVARAVDESVGEELANVCHSYHQQDFVAAAKIVNAVTQAIASAETGLTSVHTRLQELQAMRTHARETAAKATSLSNALRTKLAENAFSTSAETDRAFKQAVPTLTTLNGDIAQDQPDWVAASPESDRVLASFKQVDRAIDQEKAAYNLAKERAATLREQLADAHATVSHDDTRAEARRLYNAAKTALTEAEATLKIAKSDWDAVVRNLSDEPARVTEAVTKAGTDQRQARAARAAVASARERIGEVERTGYRKQAEIGNERRTFGASTRADLSNAAGLLAAAVELLADKDWSEAKRKADAAVESANRADENAADAVAQAISAALSAYESEQRRLAAQAQARANNSGGGGGGGGSLPGGGGGGGGNNRSTGVVEVSDSPRTGGVQSNDFD